MKRVFIHKVTKVLLLVFITACLPGPSPAALAARQDAPSRPDTNSAAQAASTTGAVALYRELLNPTFDPKDVYQIREVSILREDLHISISDGTMALIHAVDGHITGAVFEGVGEVLLVPPNRAERTSLALFTGSAVLEQHFQSAYFRFFDDSVVKELRAGFRAPACHHARRSEVHMEYRAADVARVPRACRSASAC